MLYFHGGPEWEERPSANPYLPALVSAGYSVFAVNVRGSTGAGRAYEHADEVHRRPDGIRDVADTVAYLVEAGIADPDRVVCTGRSYGGYLTMAALAQRLHHLGRLRHRDVGVVLAVDGEQRGSDGVDVRQG